MKLRLFAVMAGGGSNSLVGVDNSNGADVGSNLVRYFLDNPAFASLRDISFDLDSGYFFIVDSDGLDTNGILRGNIADLANNNAAPTLTRIFETTGTFELIPSMEVDTANNKIYWVDGSFDVGWEVRRSDYDGSNNELIATLDDENPDNLFGFPGGIADFIIDPARNTAYILSTFAFIDGLGNATVLQNHIVRLDGLNPDAGEDDFTVLTAGDGDGSDGYVPGRIDPSFGQIIGIDVDRNTGQLYFITQPISSTDHGGIFKYDPATDTFTLLWEQPTPATDTDLNTYPTGYMTFIEFDEVANQYYVTTLSHPDDEYDATPGVNEADSSIFIGDPAGGAPERFIRIHNPGEGAAPLGMEIDYAADLSLTGSGSTYTETPGAGSPAGAPVDVAGALAIADADQATVWGATVAITAGFVSGDALSFTPSGGITGSYNALTGVLTLSGQASPAAYQAVLDSVAFTNAGDNPTNFGANTSRTVSFTVFDGLISSDPATATVNVTGVNDAPVNTTGGAVATSEDAASVAVPGLSVSDPDNASLTVTLAVGRGTLTLGGTAGLAFSTGDGTNDATMTFSGTAAAINAALAGLSYTPTANINGADSLTMTTSDGSATDVDNVAINVAAVNDAPTVAGDGTESAAPIVQDMPSPVGQSVASLFAGQYSDAVDQVAGGSSADPFAGVAVTANGSGASGQWQYYNGAIWVNVGAASTGAAVLLAATTSVRFNPAPGFTGAAPTLTVHLVDGSGGALTSGTLANLSVTGGTTRYSTGTVVLSETVIPGNTPPTGVSGTLTIIEDANNGATVGTVVAADPDSSTFTYSLVNDAGGRFNISSSGVVTVENGLLLDYEQNASHVIRVRVDDNEGGISEFNMNVTVTDDHGEFVTGDGANHIYYGGAETDFLFGGHGSDTIRGQGGIDFIFGGDGLIDTTDGGDNLNGGSGSDVILGNGGDDIIAGGTDSDVLSGNEGSDTIYGGESVNDAIDAGNDIISGDAGNDFLYGNGGNDIILGGTENDQLYGGAGNDELDGGSGVDRLDGGAGADDLTGGTGNDVFVFRKGQANGDEILDFGGNGSGAGDSIRLEGYAAGTTFTRVGGSDTWKINDHGFIEYITIDGHASVHSTDWVIVP
ncbi:MAG TPA: cadherin domain-containing protein [Allosphingosinicella sp.]|jgi:hypothetical protein|nr:cadherin domain-containing protein [Allosphingosinicella sp.]